MKTKLKNYLYKAGTLSLSGVMALSLCAPALTASANTQSHANHHVQRVYFWDETPVQHKTHKGRKATKRTKKGRKARTRRTRKGRKATPKKRKGKKSVKKAPKKRANKRSKYSYNKKKMEKKILAQDKAILHSMNGQLNGMMKDFHHQKANRVYKTLRQHGYSYNQTIAILASVQGNTNGRYMNTNIKYDTFGYFNFAGSYMHAYNRYARRTHQPRWNIITQLHFMNRGHRSFKKAKGTQYKLFRQFNHKMEDEHGYFVPSHKHAIQYIRLARNARK